MKKILPVRMNRLRMGAWFLLLSSFFMLIFALGYRYIRQITRNQVFALHEQKLAEGVRELDTILEALGNLKTIVNSNVSLNEMVTADDLKLDKIRSFIATYVLPYDVIADVGISRENKILLTRKRIYYEMPYLTSERYFRLTDLEVKSLPAMFTGKYSVLPAHDFFSVDQGTYKAFTIAWRWSKALDIYLFVTFSVDKVISAMVQPNVLESSSISIFYNDEMVASNDIIIDPKSKLLTMSTRTIPLSISIWIPNSYIEKDLENIRQLARIIAVIVMTLALLWVVLLAIAASKPLDEVTRALLSLHHKPPNTERPYTFSNLVDSIKSIDLRLTNYEDLFAAQNQAMKTHILEKALFRGLYSDDAHVEFNNAFPDFPKYWQMAIIQFVCEFDIVENALLFPVFEALLKKYLPKALFVTSGKETLVGIFPCGIQSPQDILEDARKTIERGYRIILQYTLSETASSPAALAGIYQLLEQETLIINKTDEISSHKSKFPMSIQDLDNMYRALSYGDGKAALELLHITTRQLCDDEDLFLAKYTYQLIANMLVMIKLESESNLTAIPIPSFNHEEIKNLFENELPKCFMEISWRIQSDRKTFAQNQSQQICRFIQENICNHQLCINFVTDHFNISAPTLQKHLRETVGKTFSAYVEEIRMIMARNELRNTMLSVQEIALKCGYTSPNSFHKAYKRYFGEAPLDVRKH